MVDLHGAVFGEPRVSTPEALVLMHLKQQVLNARVNAGGDDALDLHALACTGVLLVTVAIVGSDAAGVPQGEVGWSCTASSVPKGAHVQPGLRRAEQPGSGQQLTGQWRRCVGQLLECACRIHR